MADFRIHPARTTSARVAQRSGLLLQTFSIAILLALAVGLEPLLTDLSLAVLCQFGIFCAILSLALVARASSKSIWSAAFVYLTVLFIFHFGLAFSYGLGLPISSEREAPWFQWFYSYETKYALLMGVFGIMSCALGIHVACSMPTSFLQLRIANFEDERFGRAFAVTGFAMVFLSISAWFGVLIIAGGLGLAFGSYLDYLNAVKGMPLAYVWLGTCVGVAFLAAAPPSKLRKFGFIIMVLWALVALPLGLRGEILFPLTTVLVVLGKRKAPVRTVLVPFILIGVLLGIAAIKEVRKIGVQDVGSSQINANPLDALNEMGSSLRPIREVILWNEQGDGFVYGATYWSTIDRALARVIPGWPAVPPAEEDDRIMNVMVLNRAGPIGFSPIAEAYRNFGATGVIAIMFLTGFLLSHLDLLASTRTGQVLAGVLFCPFLIQVRNDFAATPFQLVIGLILLYSSVFFARSLKT